MTSSNALAVRRFVQAWTDRDWEAIGALYADPCTVIDHAQHITLKSRAEAVEVAQAWAKAFPDGVMDDVRILDAGDTVVLRFVGRGTHTGPLNGMAPTNQRMELPFCVIAEFGPDGLVHHEEDYYDIATLLTQLGVITGPSGP